MVWKVRSHIKSGNPAIELKNKGEKKPPKMSRQIGPSMTTTVTLENPSPSPSPSQQAPPQTLVLTLNRKKKKVSWKEGTVDNEFLQKKSSKKCCIFHKDKPFDEDSSDDDEADHDHCHDHGDKDHACSSKSSD